MSLQSSDVNSAPAVWGVGDDPSDTSNVVRVRPPSQRRRIFANGFPAVVVDGKSPVTDAWQTGPITEERLKAETQAHRHAKSTGSRTGEFVPFDIDITDPAHVELIKSAIFEVCGPTPAVREGAKGCALCYRNLTPIAKAKVVEGGKRPAGEKPQAVEVLGVGQQLVVHGVHPDTGRPYRWVGDFDPVKNRLDELPLVTPERIFLALDRVAECLASLGYREPRRTGAGYHRQTMAPETEFGRPGASKSIKAGEPLTVPQLTRYLSEIDPEMERDGWRDIVAAIRACPGPDAEELREVAQGWSAGAFMFDERYRGAPPPSWGRASTVNGLCADEAVDQVFDTLPPKPGGRGIGSIICASDKARHARGLQSFLKFIDAPAADLPPSAGDGLRFKLFSLREIRARPPIAWLLPDTLPEASLVEIFGFPQAGKTWWGLDMALHLATGRAGYNRPEGEPVDVIYFCGEGAKPFAQKRATAWCIDRGYDPDDPSAVRLHVLELAPDLSSDEDLQQLIDDIKAQGVRPKAIFLDTLARVLSASGWDEVTKDLGQFIHQAERIKRGFDCTVIMLHHTPVDNDTRARGGGALSAGIAAEFRLKGNICKQTLNANRAVVYAVCTKMQDDEKDETPRYWRARRAHGGLVLDPVSQAEGEALLRQRDEPLDILRHEIRTALEELWAGDPNLAEVRGPYLASTWLQLDEREKVDRGGYTHRSADQMKQDADRWLKHTVNVAAAKTGSDGRPLLHDLLVLERNGEPKRGPRGEYVFRPQPSKLRPPLETGVD